MKVGYCRVSTADQNLASQQDALRAAGCNVVFDDKISGATRKRAGLDKALDTLGKGDKLIVHRLCRLGRSFKNLCAVTDQIHSKGAYLVSLSEGIDTSNDIGLVVLRLMSVFADFERTLIVERTVAGLASARARGARLGRPRKLDTAQITEANRLLHGGQRVNQVAGQFGIARSTLHRLKRA